ncbi:unnamed protein product [Malus baccata var. baccata]
MRKLLEFDFSTAIDGAIKDEAAKIKVVEDEVSDERNVKCKSGCCPLTICVSSCAFFRLGWHEQHGKIGMAGTHGARLAQL